MDDSGIIYLLRHCETANEEVNYPVLVGQEMSYTLSEKGKARARILARFFASKEVDAIYTSPLPRAVQTAAIIEAENEYATITVCSSLEEADVGEWEGLTYEQISRGDEANHAAFLKDPGTYGYPGGENYTDITIRAYQLIEQIARDHVGDRVVVISHKQVNRAVLACLMRLPLHRVREIDQDPGCVNLIRNFRGDLELRAVNYTSDFELAEEEEDENEADKLHPPVSCSGHDS